MLCCAKLHIAILGRTVLVELRLKSYAVIDNAAIEFASGLNFLTGETGAGKSILIDALALLLGEKASSEVIRTGAERAVVSAVFESRDDPKTRSQACSNATDWMNPKMVPSWCDARSPPAERAECSSTIKLPPSRYSTTGPVLGHHSRAERIDPVFDPPARLETA